MALLEIPTRKSFRRQIILAFVVGFSLLIAAFAAFLIVTERDNLHRDSMNETTSMAGSLAASALPWVLADDVAGLQEVVRAFRGYPEFNFAIVTSPDGRVLAHSDPSKIGMFLVDEQSQNLAKSPHEIRVMEDSSTIIEIAAPIEINNRQVGWARVSSTKLENTANLHKMIVESIVFLLAATILSFIAATLIANRLGQRIGSLVRVAEGVQAGNYSARAGISGGEDEVARLGNSLNAMLDTLSQNQQDLRAATHYTRSLIEASLDPLVTISPEGKITDVNRATEKATGLNRTELIGTDFSDYFTEPDKAHDGYRKVFAEGFVTDYPLSLRHSDGNVTDVLYNASVYRDETGKVLGVFAAARDVSEQKKAVAAMRESEALLHATIDILPMGLWILNAHGKISFSNEAARQIWAGVRYVGLEQLGEYKGWRVDNGKLVGPHEWAGVRALEKGETTIGEEVEIECFDGTHKIILDSAVPLRNADGSMRCAVTLNQDITERKRAEMALQQSEEVLKEAQRIAHLGSWYMDVATNEVVWSEELYKIYGFDPALPPPLYTESMKLFTPESWERLSAAIAQATEAGIPYELELETVNKDGGKGWMWARGEPVHDARGAVIRVRGVVMDITERKKLETQARQAAAYTRSLIEASLDPLVTISADGKITDVNQATENATGRSRSDLVGTDFADYFTEPDKARTGYQRVFAKGFVTDYPLALRHLDGHITEVLYNASVYRDEKGNVLGMFAAARDITERKLAEKELREKEERLALATLINGVGIWDWNLRTQEMIWDDSMYALYHIRREDFIGTEEAWRKSLHPDDLTRGDKEVADAIAGIKPFDTEFRVVWPNGEIHHIRAVARVFRDEHGTPVRMLGTNMDITEGKKAEDALFEAQQVYRTLIENSPDIIARYDRDCRRTYVNPMYLKATQIPEQELLATGPAQISPLPAASAGLLQNLLRKVLDSGVAEAIDVLWQKADNNDSWYNIYAFPEHDREGRVVSVMTVSRDITERKRAEEELRERESHSQSLLRLSKDMERALTYADVMNAARDEVRSILGYQNLWAYLFTEDKKYAKSLVASGPETDFIMSEEGTATLTIEGDRMLEEIAASKEIVLVADAQTDERVNKEIVTRMRNRTIVNIPIILFDRHLGCVGTGTFGEEGVRVPTRPEQNYLMALASHMAAAFDRIHLLAERKLAEDEVKSLNRELEQRVATRTAELEASNKELEAFSYSVSHDLRSPLRAIDGFSHILLDDYANTLDVEGKRLLGVVRDNTAKMGQLIDDILKFSRAGRLEMTLLEIDMGALVRDIYEELRPTAAGHDLQVEIGPLPPAMGDRAMMRQVLVNLLSNAIKFTRSKSPSIIKVGSYSANNETVYFVQDNGAGFDMRYADRLFGVFQRLHTETEFEGTGIGLAIVKRIVSRHGGRAWAEGKVNEGATIYFALPAAEAAPE